MSDPPRPDPPTPPIVDPTYPAPEITPPDPPPPRPDEVPPAGPSPSEPAEVPPTGPTPPGPVEVPRLSRLCQVPRRSRPCLGVEVRATRSSVNARKPPPQSGGGSCHGARPPPHSHIMTRPGRAISINTTLPVESGPMTAKVPAPGLEVPWYLITAGGFCDSAGGVRAVPLATATAVATRRSTRRRPGERVGLSLADQFTADVRRVCRMDATSKA